MKVLAAPATGASAGQAPVSKTGDGGPTPPASAELVDKRGRPLRGAARKVAEIKKRDGKGPRPPRKGARHGDIAPSMTATGDNPPQNGRSATLRDRLSRLW